LHGRLLGPVRLVSRELCRYGSRPDPASGGQESILAGEHVVQVADRLAEVRL
jgi:hypothetical protein